MTHETTRSRRTRRPRAERTAVIGRNLAGVALLGSVLALVAALPAGAARPEPPVPTASPPVPASSTPLSTTTSTGSAAGSCPDTDFTTAVLCWGRTPADARDSVIVTVSAPQELNENDDSRPVSDALGRLRGRLTVIVPDGVRTGSGGTLLLALATHRVVGRHSVASPLTERGRRQLLNLGGCPADGFCDYARTQRSAGDLVRRGLAQDSRTSLFTVGSAARDGGAGGTDGGTGDDGSETGGASGDAAFLLVVLAVLLCLVTALGLLIGRTRRPRGPFPATAGAATATRHGGTVTPESAGGVQGAARASGPGHPPRSAPGGDGGEAPPYAGSAHAAAPDPRRRTPGGKRLSGGKGEQAPTSEPAPRQRSADGHARRQDLLPGTVRTALRPQGYVAVNGLLYRATWSGDGEPPEPGQQVDLRQESTGELTVLDNGPDGSRSG
ncbi:hypothetical protein [Streptomyces sp. GbtcB6]|uniref:hypothetical protein n=1 Tax=Streptomyces sp. GbtcB6 TaxID=2824751 RepID=UPI001C306398|nr:hypothetical protein [Streptomyces sp. GbtcB6]